MLNKKPYSKQLFIYLQEYQIIDLDIQRILIDKLSYIQTQPGFPGTLKAGPFKQAIFCVHFRSYEDKGICPGNIDVFKVDPLPLSMTKIAA